MRELHGQIILNLRAENYPPGLQVDAATAYRMGHRDARHDAAELALKADAEILRLHSSLECEKRWRKDAEEDAERYRWLREGCNEKWSAASRIAADCFGMEWDAKIDAEMAWQG